MEKLCIAMLFVMLSTAASGQTDSGMVAGKTYRALIRQSCSKTTNGGYMTYTYCELNFERDSVSVSEYSHTSNNYLGRRTISEEKYGYTTQSNTISIDGITSYETLSILDGKLKTAANDRRNEVVFEEVTAE